MIVKQTDSDLARLHGCGYVGLLTKAFTFTKNILTYIAVLELNSASGIGLSTMLNISDGPNNKTSKKSLEITKCTNRNFFMENILTCSLIHVISPR